MGASQGVGWEFVRMDLWSLQRRIGLLNLQIFDETHWIRDGLSSRLFAYSSRKKILNR